VSPEAGNRPPPDSRSLAASLAPVLGEACAGHLGDEITWFKADWQRGGAATGLSTFRLAEGDDARVVVKLPVVGRELLWTRRLQRDDEQAPTVPKLYASGQSLGGYDLAWVVIEWFPHGPLGTHWHDDHTVRIAEAAADFYAAAGTYPVDQQPTEEPWDDLLREAQRVLKVNTIDQKQRWSSALKSLRSRLDRLVEQWNARDVHHWLHGDLHFANAMSRVSLESGPVSLIDLAEVHPGHWVEDAVYLERQLWARPERLKVRKPVQAIARARKARGLPVDEDYPRLAMLRRALLAGTAPRFLKSEGDPRHLAACLEWLERALTELK
jgi:hypothetical protein